MTQTLPPDTAETLLHLARAVAGAKTIDDMIRVMIDVAAPVLGASNATIGLLDEGGTRLAINHGPWGTTTERWVEVADPTPGGNVARTGIPEFFESAEELGQKYPSLVRRARFGDLNSLAVLPLRSDGALLGSAMFRYINPVVFTPERKELLATATDILADALGRAADHDRLVAYARQLKEFNRDLDSFAAAVAHDLRQPLRQIGSYVHLLLESRAGDGAQAEHFSQRILASLSRADSLILALLRYARAGGKPLLDEDVALARLTAEVIEALQPRLTDTGASVRCDELPVVRGDPDLIRQVLQNLIDNAAKYHDPSRPGEVVVTACAAGRDEDRTPWWRISVIDNGVGIPEDQLNAVFEVFSRASPRDDVGGIGIGLATANRIVERHGGSIGVESTVGEGSTFWFTLPGIPVTDRFEDD